jgi:predicted DNA-binding transcriptional regulator YafY
LERLERFFRIQQLLEARLSVTGLELQEALEISRATLHRDIEYLRDRLGLPIVWDAELRAYRLDKDGEQNNRVHLPGIWLNEAEIAALTVLSEPLCRVDPAHPIGLAIQPLRDRLLDILDRIGISIRDFAKRIRLVPHEIHGNPCANMPQIAHATLARRQLAIDYYSRSRGRRMTRLVSPQRLIYLRQNWYLDAWCHLRQGLRRFAFADIWGVELVEEAAYEVPEAELGEVCFSTHWGGRSSNGQFCGSRPLAHGRQSMNTGTPNKLGSSLPWGSMSCTCLTPQIKTYLATSCVTALKWRSFPPRICATQFEKLI